MTLCAPCGVGVPCFLHDSPPADTYQPKPVVPASREVAHTEIDDRVSSEHADHAKRVFDLVTRNSGSSSSGGAS